MLDDGGVNNDGISLRSKIKVLLQCLALMVHNLLALLELMENASSHYFAYIPILYNHFFLGELKKH